jgi:hypothetical protein
MRYELTDHEWAGIRPTLLLLPHFGKVRAPILSNSARFNSDEELELRFAGVAVRRQQYFSFP